MIIKRNDSVTSILLFIFNVFLSKQGINEVSIKKILRLLEPFEKSETSIRMGLSRGMQKGLMTSRKKNTEVYYRVTERTVQWFSYWWQTMQRFEERIALQQQSWDGKWSIIYTSGNCHEVVRALNDYGYGMLEKYLFISPYNFHDQVAQLASRYNKDQSLIIFSSENISNKTTEEIVAKAWKTKGLALRYEDFTAELNTISDKFNDDNRGSGHELPILHSLGLKLFDIVQLDPQLPVQLLPTDWSGLLAFTGFNSIKERILQGADTFIKRILSTD